MACLCTAISMLLVSLRGSLADSLLSEPSPLLIQSSSGIAKCDHDYYSLRAGMKCTTSWHKLTQGPHQLRPTEPAVGHAWVVAQMKNHFHSKKKSGKWLRKHTFPVVLGGPHFYLTDMHHHAIAIELTDDKDIWNLDITLTVVCDLRHTGDSFWNETRKQNYNLLVDRPRDVPLALPSVVSPDRLPSDWALASFGDDMWRSIAGFSSHISDDSERCYQKLCRNFVDFEWAYIINYASEVDMSLWPAGTNATKFKEMFEAMPYEPDPKSVDRDAWYALAHAVLPLCHSTAIKDFILPDFFPDRELAGWSAVPVPKDPKCPYDTCSGGVFQSVFANLIM